MTAIPSPPERRRLASLRGRVEPLVRDYGGRARQARSVVRLRPFDVSTPEGRSAERYRRIALNAATGICARAAVAAVSLMSMPLTLGYLGRERYGIWATVTTLTTWAALLDFGVVNGLVNAVSEANGRDDPRAAREYVSTALALLGAVAVALAVAMGAAAALLPWHSVLAVPPGLVGDAALRWSVVAAFAPFLVALPLSVVRQVYAGYQQTYVGNAFQVAGAVASLGGLLFVVRGDLGMPATIAAAAGGAAVVAAANFVFLTRVQMPWLRPSRAAVTRAAARRLTRTSVPLFLFQAGALLVNETQLLILAHRSGLGTVADYAVVMRVYLMASSLITLGTGAFVPPFREAHERGDVAWVRASFRRMLVIRMAAALTAAAAFVLAGDWMLAAWLRQPSVHVGAATWAGAGVLLVGATWVSAHADLLTILDRVWVQVGLVLANGATTVALTYLLAPHFGVAGAIAATAVFTLAVPSWLLPRLARGLLRAAAARGAAGRA